MALAMTLASNELPRMQSAASESFVPTSVATLQLMSVDRPVLALPRDGNGRGRRQVQGWIGGAESRFRPCRLARHRRREVCAQPRERLRQVGDDVKKRRSLRLGRARAEQPRTIHIDDSGRGLAGALNAR